MNLQVDDNDFKYFSGLSDIEPEYKSVPVWNVLQFFCLKGRRTVLSADNICPIQDLSYVIFSHQEQKYYLRQSHNWSLNELYFYRKDIDFSGENETILALHRYVSDNNLFLILLETEVAETTAMLQRLYKSHFVGEGKVSYKAWLKLLDESLKLEDYKGYGSSLPGFKTVCNQFNLRIGAIWEEIYKQNNK
jgi:hypothetical protein